MTRVTSLTSVYNGEKYIARCIDSLIHQTEFLKEILVINSGSTDRTQNIIDDYEITSIQTKREPLYKSWNRGLALANSEYILICNSDDWMEITAMEIMSEILDNHPEAVLVYGDFIIHHPNGEMEARVQEPYDQKRFREKCLVGPSPMFRKSLLTGGFREDMMVSADWDAWCKMSKVGLLVHVPQVLSHYSYRLDGIEHSNPERKMVEDELVRKMYC